MCTGNGSHICINHKSIMKLFTPNYIVCKSFEQCVFVTVHQLYMCVRNE